MANTVHHSNKVSVSLPTAAPGTVARKPATKAVKYQSMQMDQVSLQLDHPEPINVATHMPMRDDKNSLGSAPDRGNQTNEATSFTNQSYITRDAVNVREKKR